MDGCSRERKRNQSYERRSSDHDCTLLETDCIFFDNSGRKDDIKCYVPEVYKHVTSSQLTP